MDETLFLTSDLLRAKGVAHGFSIRSGGVSQGPFASLNLSLAVGDEPAHVRENLLRLARAAGLAGADRLATAKQIHGDRFLLARHGDSRPVLEELFAPTEPNAAAVSGEQHKKSETQPAEIEADAIVSRTPGLAAAVRIADCTPILLWSAETRTGAAVHSGWRGAKLSISGRGVQALESYGAVASGIIAAIGPCIGRCCYAVSGELAQAFRAEFGPEVADDPEGSKAGTSPHLDLRACAAIALERRGVTAERIDQVGGCTSCEPERYYSHRRDAGRTGRHLAFIAP
jgi:YfiH family protein